MLVDKTLREKLRIDDVEIFHRMQLLEMSQDDIDLLAGARKAVEQEIESIVEAFYRHQTAFDEIAVVIGDAETMRRLRAAQRQYILELFSGCYDGAYVNSRLRIGLVHKRIGVEPKLFLAGVFCLKRLLGAALERAIADPARSKATLEALDKLLQFDTALVFDTYIDTLVSEVESAKRRTERYAQALEEKARKLGNYAERDPLTDLYNKRGLTTLLKTELRLAQRRRSLLSLIYLDVDKFKSVNDAHGHARGDEILKTLGDCIRESVRSSDLACRIGGDEFCVILPDCDSASATTIADRIARVFAAREHGVTVSFGVSETGAQDYVDEDDLLHIADERMYADKAAKMPQDASIASAS